MTDELARSVELLERLLGDPDLRRRFRNDAAAVLAEAGLPELAAGLGRGGRALMTLEMRESRSSLAGVMVAAAAEGVDLAQFAEHAAPALAHDAGTAISHLVQQPHHAAPTPAPAVAPHAPGKPDFDPPPETPSLAQPAPTPAGADASLPAAQPAAPVAAPQPQGASVAQPTAMQTPVAGRAAGHTRPVSLPARHGGGHRGSGGAVVSPARRASPRRAPRPGRWRPSPLTLARPTPETRPAPSRSRRGWARTPSGPDCRPSLPVMAALTESGLPQPLLRRPRLRGLLPDAPGDMGPGGVYRLPE